MSDKNAFGMHNDFISSCAIEPGNLNETRVVINNEKMFPFEEICPDFLPRKFRQTRWYQWLCVEWGSTNTAGTSMFKISHIHKV